MLILNPEKTNCIELFEFVFPNQNYVIQDGIIKVKDICTFYCNGSDANVARSRLIGTSALKI